MKKPELLSPAGNMDALKAAVANGADAVYLGAASFGARASAGFEDAKLKEYALGAWVNLSSMTPEETEAYYAEQYDLFASYLSDYID